VTSSATSTGLPPASGPRLLAFLGGTIGNFAPASRARFLRTIAGLLSDGGPSAAPAPISSKDRATLEAAYDDSAGITAEFNRNILHVINRELGANFDPAGFQHIARFDAENEWVEMRLRAREVQEVYSRRSP